MTARAHDPKPIAQCRKGIEHRPHDMARHDGVHGPRPQRWIGGIRLAHGDSVGEPGDLRPRQRDHGSGGVTGPHPMPERGNHLGETACAAT